MRQRIGLLGGTFDPIHNGHLIVASEVLHSLQLDEVLFVPAGRPPHKPDQIVSNDTDRLAMINAAIVDRPGFGISMLDIERNGPSFSADLLRIFTAQNENAQIYFIMGTDSLVDLPSWHDPAVIIRYAEIVVADRPGISIDLSELEDAVPGVAARLTFVDVPQMEISSREIRQRVRQQRPIWYLTPRAVEDYIARNRLYLAD